MSGASGAGRLVPPVVQQIVERPLDRDLRRPAGFGLMRERITDDQRIVARPQARRIRPRRRWPESRHAEQRVEQVAARDTPRRSRRCRDARAARAAASIRYARTVSRTSVMSRRASRLPTRRTGSRSPASISAICRAKLDVTNDGDCRGPAWLNGRTRKTGAWSARTASISCASLLTPYGSDGPMRIVLARAAWSTAGRRAPSR